MSRKSPKPLSSLLFQPGSPLQALASRAAAAVSLADGLRAALPAALGEHVQGASLREDGTLVVLAASSAWAARLRFEAPLLLDCARRLEPAARSIEVRVAGAAAPRRPPG